ncbi:hypothetical protein GCM10028804_45500 [Larkinella terrae]
MTGVFVVLGEVRQENRDKIARIVFTLLSDLFYLTETIRTGFPLKITSSLAAAWCKRTAMGEAAETAK